MGNIASMYESVVFASLPLKMSGLYANQGAITKFCWSSYEQNFALFQATIKQHSNSMHQLRFSEWISKSITTHPDIQTTSIPMTFFLPEKVKLFPSHYRYDEIRIFLHNFFTFYKKSYVRIEMELSPLDSRIYSQCESKLDVFGNGLVFRCGRNRKHTSQTQWQKPTSSEHNMHPTDLFRSFNF